MKSISILKILQDSKKMQPDSNVIKLIVGVASFFLLAACLKQNAYAVAIIGSNTDTLINRRSFKIVYEKNLRKMHVMSSAESIKQAWMIEGMIVANDEHDNFYKSIIVQDSTGGIVLQLDGVNLYQSYPVGALVRIRLQNLWLTDYRRMVQLSATVDTSSGSLITGGIPIPLLDKYINIVKNHVTVLPLEVGFKNLGDSLQARWIHISGVEFGATDTAQTYADKKNKAGMSRALKFCTSGTIYLRTSGYADFADIKTPTGNGGVGGIYSVYNYEKQLVIRDTSDILLKNKRCTGMAWLQNRPQ